MSSNKVLSSNKTAKKKHGNERAHQLKVYSVGSVLILLAIVLLMNILLDVFFGKSLTFDFSVERSNVISDESQKFLDSLPQDTRIRIVGLFEKPDSIYGTELQYILPLLDDYVKKSGGKVSVEYVDMQKNPGIITELDPEGSYNLSSLTGQFVIKYNGKIDIIDPVSCYNIDMDALVNNNKYVATGINTEYTFTNSMMSLVKGFANKAYLVTGLKENNGSEKLKKILNSIGVETAELPNSAGFKIPEDSDLLILNGPNVDITEAMSVEIKAYIEKGGKVIVALDYYIDNANESYENLNRLLNEMNINVEKCFVSENDPSYRLDVDTDSKADVAESYVSFASVNKLHITLARPLGSIGSDNPDYTTKPVMMTSSSATKSVANSNNQAEQYGSDTGVFNVVMHSACNKSGGEIYVFGTLNFTGDDYFTRFSIRDSNADFTRGCVRSMLPKSAQYNINIPVKAVEGNMLDNNKTTTSVSTGIMVVFMIVLPLILTSMAVIVYNRRKNL